MYLYKERVNKVKAVLEAMTSAELVAVHNDFCERACRMSDYVYDMSDFNSLMSDMAPLDIVMAVNPGSFWPGDKWFWDDGTYSYDSCCQHDVPDPVDVDAIAEFAVEQDMDFGRDDIREALRAMARISIDNGASYTTPAEALDVIGLDTIAAYMDDDAREAVHAELAPCTDLAFVTRYLEIAGDDLIIG